MMPQEGAASVQRPARPAGRYQLAVILDATRALRSGQRLGNSARLSKLIVQAHDAGARSLLDQIAEPLRVAARADALVLGPAEHPSGVDGITVGIAV
jgi:hypothetical protein